MESWAGPGNKATILLIFKMLVAKQQMCTVLLLGVIEQSGMSEGDNGSG